MDSKDKKYIIQNLNKKSVKDIAKDLNLKERKIIKFLEEKKINAPHSNKINNKLGPLSYFEWACLGFVFILALIIRIEPVIDNPEKNFYGRGIFGDTHLYHCIAYNLYKGNGFSWNDDGGAYGQPIKKIPYQPAVIRGPVYPFFMYLVYKVFGSSEDMHSIETWHKNWDKVRLAQCLLDALVCLVVFFTVWTISHNSFWPSIIASLLYCFSFYNIFFTRALLSETVTTFLLSFSLFFYVSGLARNKHSYFLMSGVSFALVVLGRGEYILFIPALLGYLIYFNRKSLKIALKRTIIFAICFAAVILPWTLRNYRIFKKPILITAAPPAYNFFVGTFEDNGEFIGWGKFPDRIFSSPEEREKVESLYKAWALYASTGDTQVNKVDKQFWEFAFKRIKTHPWEVLKTWITRIPRLWYQNYVQMFAYREPSGWFFVLYFIFAIYALLYGSKNEKLLMVPAVLLFFYLTLLLLPFHVESRYSVPAMPSIICLTGIGIWRAWSWLKEKIFS